MSKVLQKAAVTIALIMAICFVVAGCGTKSGETSSSGAKTSGIVKRIVEAFDAKEYDEAYALFYEADMTSEQQASLAEALSERIDKAVDDYSVDNIDADTARLILSEAQSFNLSKLKTKLTTSQSTLNDLSASKIEFANGLIALGKQDWLSAVEAFSKVVEKDCNYSDAIQKNEEAERKLMDEISAQIALGEYDAALQLAEQFRSLQPANSEVAAKIAEINSAKAEQALAAQRTEALNAAQASYNQGNYTEAFDTLDDFIKSHNDDQETIDALAQYKDNYANMIVQKADEAIKKQEYLRALDMLNNAITVLPDQRIFDKKTELDAVKPTYLCELSCADSKTYKAAKPGETYTGVTGEAYDYAYGNLFILVNECGVDGYANYFLNYGYKTLKLTLDVSDESRQGDSFKLSIIGDGIVLQEFTISRTFAPTQIELDVSNIGWIELKTSGHKGSTFGKMYTIISDAHLEK